MHESLPANPNLIKLYQAAKRLAKLKVERARLAKALANWPTKTTTSVQKLEPTIGSET